MRHNAFFPLAFFALLISSSSAIARPPNAVPEPPAIAAREFVPYAGYARTTRVLHLDRLAANTRNEARASFDALSGNRNIPTILIAFANKDAPFPAARFQSLLFEDVAQDTVLPRLTLTAFYRDVSHGKLLVGGRVFGWYTLPKNDDYYENNDIQNGVMRNGDGTPFGELLQFGLEKADAEIDFGLYDNDGPDGIPNSGDDDGKVDTVFFIHPKSGAECGNDSRTNIWSHSWHYSEKSFGHSSPYVTRAIRMGKDHKPVLNDDGTPQHIVVEDYTIQPAIACPSENEPAKIIPIGVFCHEFGHALGLPDLYDRKGVSEGIGNWCLMAGGSYGGDGQNAQCPASMSAWCKAYLGWAATETITENGKFYLESVEDRGRMYRLNVPNTGRREYFLVEFRNRDWRDDIFHVRQNWDQFLPASGVAVWHVDERVGEGPNWPFAVRGQGQNDTPSMPGATTHSMVSLCQKDRKLDLEFKKNRGDATDLLGSGDIFKDDAEFLFGSRGYDGKGTNINIAAVDLNTRLIEFQYGNVLAGRNAAPGTKPIESVRILPTAVSEKDQSERVRLSEVVEKIGLGHELTYIETKTLESAERVDLERATSLSVRPSVMAASAAVRTRTVASTTTANFTTNANWSDPRVAALLRMQAAGTELTIQFSADHERAEMITGLNLVAEVATVQSDGMLRLTSQLKLLVGQDIDLTIKTETVPTTRPTTGPVAQHFWQNTKVEGKSLPVFGTETVLFFNDGNLKTLQSNTVAPRKLRITGKQAVFNIDQAKKLVADQLGFSSKTLDTIKECREGVFLPNDDPAKARVAYRVCIPAGEGQEPIHVYLDSETKQILKVK